MEWKARETEQEKKATRFSIWKLGGLSFRELARLLWHEFYEGKLLLYAAALSFYFLLALFPLLLFIVTLLGFFAESGAEMQAVMLALLSRLLPASASLLVRETVNEIVVNADRVQLWLGLASALWFASSGVAALSEALNAIYGVSESRPFWRVRLLAITMTVALVVLILTALVLMLYGGEIGAVVAGHFERGELFTTLWAIAQVPFVLAFVLLAFALIYYFAPDLYDQKWYWITPGSVTGVAMWLLVSYLFRLYLRQFNSYTLTYGSLGAVIILMLWFYLTGVAILAGGKINAEIENAAARAGIPEAKRSGEKSAET
jgi:membrane protein